MIEVRIQDSPSWGEYDVYICDVFPHEVHLMQLMNGRVEHFKSYQRGQAIDLIPTFRLRPEVLKALSGALSDFLPPDKAMANHLKDAVTVRDRLLTIVEKNS